jgi:hypothetical protein
MPLAGFPSHDVVIIVADEGFRYALLSLGIASELTF